MYKYRTNYKGTLYEVSGRDKNLLISIYENMDTIAYKEEWEAFWKDKYNIEPMNEFSSNRKFLWSLEENKWCYTDMHNVEVYPDQKTI